MMNDTKKTQNTMMDAVASVDSVASVAPLASQDLVDLHMHSTFSDGRYTPTQLVEGAAAKGLKVLALTDHDSWNGVHEAQAAAARLGNIRVLTGVELGTQC